MNNLSAENHRLMLNDGNRMPLVGLGTYADPKQTPKGTCAQAVKIAIDAGYRHIDGAYVYYNEHEVGEAIREKITEGKLKREDIFYCGKLWNTCHPPDLVRPTLERTLKTLQLDYVDLYIIELPMAFKPGEVIYPMDENGKWLYHETDLCATWEVRNSEASVYLQWLCLLSCSRRGWESSGQQLTPFSILARVTRPAEKFNPTISREPHNSHSYSNMSLPNWTKNILFSDRKEKSLICLAFLRVLCRQCQKFTFCNRSFCIHLKTRIVLLMTIYIILGFLKSHSKNHIITYTPFVDLLAHNIIVNVCVFNIWERDTPVHLESMLLERIVGGGFFPHGASFTICSCFIGF
uniref:NADP-dependent oxidoreductase domain-containing protein n=1 Tax=Anolis carolinensis TaxID=28377 RepID=A0A803SNR9_ANOCA